MLKNTSIDASNSSLNVTGTAGELHHAITNNVWGLGVHSQLPSSFPRKGHSTPYLSCMWDISVSWHQPHLGIFQTGLGFTCTHNGKRKACPGGWAGFPLDDTSARTALTPVIGPYGIVWS